MLGVHGATAGAITTQLPCTPTTSALILVFCLRYVPLLLCLVSFPLVFTYVQECSSTIGGLRDPMWSMPCVLSTRTHLPRVCLASRRSEHAVLVADTGSDTHKACTGLPSRVRDTLRTSKHKTVVRCILVAPLLQRWRISEPWPPTVICSRACSAFAAAMAAIIAV